jgi:hypothetical protein
LDVCALCGFRYDDGGYENSTRVFGVHGFDMQPPLHCKTYVQGDLNNPAANNEYWSVEVAMPLYKLAYNTTVDVPPTPGQFWRINFSRVEWAVKIIDGVYQKYPSCQSCPQPGTDSEDNWVWSPQGQIDMHLPERWGMLQFADGPVNATEPVRNPQWTVRSVAMALYYAEHAYADQNNGSFTDDLSLLQAFAPPHVLDGTCTHKPMILLQNGTAHFTAQVPSLDNGMVASITDDRYLTVQDEAQ